MFGSIKKILGLSKEEKTEITADKAVSAQPNPKAYNSVGDILASQEFDSAYNALINDQREKFFLAPDRKLDAARVIYSIHQLIGPVGSMSQLLEIYIAIFVRLDGFRMPPERIVMTLKMRYSSILSTEQQYEIIAFTEAHINGMNQGFYIKTSQDVERIKNTAQSCHKAAHADKGVADSPDYGFSADNPIRVQSIPAEYNYIDKLSYDNGAIVKKERVCSVGNANGDLVDYFLITVMENNQEKGIRLFLDGYGESPSCVAPQGFHLMS